MKVAIIHYWFITRRGGEKVVESILNLYPQADIYTLFYDKETYGNYIESHKIYTSKLNTKFLRKYYQKIFPLYPLGIKSLELKENYDLIISSESGPAKGITIKNNAPHICYIHSPMRYCWGFMDEYLKSIKPILRPVARFYFKKLKKWDKSTIDNVDLYIANSKNVANRVKNFYKREAKVIYPPIENSLFLNNQKKITKEVYLSFGAITPYKKIDLLVDTFNYNKKDLIIIGNGSEKEKLLKKANKNIVFKSYSNWFNIENTFLKTKALLFPGEEDFGMIPLEVMAYGIPVIAFKKGGALETVIENRNNISESTGLFFKNQKVSSLNKTIDFFETVENKFDTFFIKKHAERFKESEFFTNFKNCVDKFMEERK